MKRDWRKRHMLNLMGRGFFEKFRRKENGTRLVNVHGIINFPGTDKPSLITNQTKPSKVLLHFSIIGLFCITFRYLICNQSRHVNYISQSRAWWMIYYNLTDTLKSGRLIKPKCEFIIALTTRAQYPSFSLQINEWIH